MSTTPAKPRPMTAKQAKLAMEIAKLAMGGATYEEIAAALRVSVHTIRRRRRHPDYDRAVERARAVLRHESEIAAEAGRGEALEAARAILALAKREPGTVGPGDVLKAAALLTSASAPASDRQRSQARADVLRELRDAPPAWKQHALDYFRGRDGAWLDGLTREEIEAIARGEDE